jgi:hypothetical protein
MRVSYPSSYPNPQTQSNRLKGKRLDGRGGGIRTPGPLLPKQMRYQAALRPDVLVRLYRESVCCRLDHVLETAGEPNDQPYGEDHGNGEDERERRSQQKQKSPVAGGVALGRFEVTAEEKIVAPVGLPEYIEDVAKQGDRSHQHADAEISGHAGQRDIGDTANPCGQRDDCGEKTGEDVSEAGDEADNGVEAKADAGAGDLKGFVEQDFKRVERAVAEEPGSAIPAVRVR